MLIICNACFSTASTPKCYVIRTLPTLLISSPLILHLPNRLFLSCAFFFPQMQAEYSGGLKYINYMKTSPVVCDVTPCFLVEVYQLLGGNYCLHPRGGKWTTRHHPEGSIAHVHHRKNLSSLTVVHMDNYGLSQYQ